MSPDGPLPPTEPIGYGAEGLPLGDPWAQERSDEAARMVAQWPDRMVKRQTVARVWCHEGEHLVLSVVKTPLGHLALPHGKKTHHRVDLGAWVGQSESGWRKPATVLLEVCFMPGPSVLALYCNKCPTPAPLHRLDLRVLTMHLNRGPVRNFRLEGTAGLVAA